MACWNLSTLRLADERIGTSEADGDGAAALRAELAITRGGFAHLAVPEGPAVAEALRQATGTLPPDHAYAQGIGYMHLAGVRVALRR